MKVFSLAIREDIAAILIGPFSVLPICIVFGSIFSLLFGGGLGQFTNEVPAYLLMGLVGIPIAYMVTLFYGLPIVLLLSKFNKLNLVYIVSLSVAPAGLFCILVVQQPYLFLVYGAISMLVSTTCWGVYKYVQ